MNYLLAAATFLIFAFGLVTSIATAQIVQEWSLAAGAARADHEAPRTVSRSLPVAMPGKGQFRPAPALSGKALPVR
jgi:hypothetical protein